MSLLGIFISILGVVFLGIVLIGAPFVPTKNKQVTVALDMLNLKPGQLLLELGGGDGRVALAAAKRGIKVIVYEINPFLALIILIRSWKCRNLIKIKVKNFWVAKWPKADGIYIFSAGLYMPKLEKKIIKSGLKPRVASFGFEIPNNPNYVLKEGVYLYNYKNQFK